MLFRSCFPNFSVTFLDFLFEHLLYLFAERVLQFPFVPFAAAVAFDDLLDAVIHPLFYQFFHDVCDFHIDA